MFNHMSRRKTINTIYKIQVTIIVSFIVETEQLMTLKKFFKYVLFANYRSYFIKICRCLLPFWIYVSNSFFNKLQILNVFHILLTVVLILPFDMLFPWFSQHF